MRADLGFTLPAGDLDVGAQPYAIRYLRGLLKTYQPLFPRRTKVARFEEVEVRALTSTELSMKRDLAGGPEPFLPAQCPKLWRPNVCTHC